MSNKLFTINTEIIAIVDKETVEELDKVGIKELEDRFKAFLVANQFGLEEEITVTIKLEDIPNEDN